MVVIDAGHGGSDPGTSGNGLLEKDYTLLISKYMKDRFDELGIPSKLTRMDDETLTPSERINRILNAYGSSRNIIVISNHLNGGGGDNPSGKLTLFEIIKYNN
ncbi:MAG: N-acetylmuramoyl-L-alanine amidase [Bacilli bacterium]|nr:N-acetylmuramoyl-L-alanine amidase [Bacilli bacterium]